MEEKKTDIRLNPKPEVSCPFTMFHLAIIYYPLILTPTLLSGLIFSLKTWQQFHHAGRKKQINIKLM